MFFVIFLKVCRVFCTFLPWFFTVPNNNKYLPLTGLLTLLQWIIHKAGKKHREIFEIFQKYFMKYFRAKKFMKFYITTRATVTRAPLEIIVPRLYPCIKKFLAPPLIKWQRTTKPFPVFRPSYWICSGIFTCDKHIVCMHILAIFRKTRHKSIALSFLVPEMCAA